MMKNVIRKILKEEFNPDDLTSPEINMSPQTQIEYAEKQYEWESYIPEIGMKIKFHMNPEHWQLSANLMVSEVGSSGHGSYGDSPHKDYQKNPLSNYSDGGHNVCYGGKVIGKGERYEFYDVKEAIKDIKEYSQEAEKFTLDFKNQIQKLTKDYIENIKPLRGKYNFTDEDDKKGVTVDKDGKYKTEEDFEKEGEGWYDQPQQFRRNSEKYEDRKI